MEDRMSLTSVTNAAATTSATPSASTSPAASVDYNTFLKLLIAEMQNQDPTNPTDAAQFMGQFAQFSSVEQAVQTNSKLDGLLTSSALAQADGLIGHTATFTTEDGQTVAGTITDITLVQGGALATLS